MSARVLIVDDDAMLRRSLALMLARAGFQITVAEDAVPAMQLTETFDVIVSDYNMGTGTGADVIKHFKDRFGGQVYCVVLSGEDDEVTARCREAGADTVMQKPALPTELRRCLDAGLTSIRSAA
jgi:sigma-B regulation protein RsbU (phosphoserine phosphatase)